MPSRPDRYRILADGRLEIVDPTIDDLPLLRAFFPEYKIEIERLPRSLGPRFMAARDKGSGMCLNDLPNTPTASIVSRSDELLGASGAPCEPDEASLLDLKGELAVRSLAQCNLCAHRCGVNRGNGELGICGRGSDASFGAAFVHIAEESFINPSFVVNMMACGLRCRYCQQWPLLFAGTQDEARLGRALWHRICNSKARTLSFAGGNPDESTPGIIAFLKTAPAEMLLPVVWNTHAYSTPETLQVLDGLVDVYLPDLKFGNDACSQRLASAPGYFGVAVDAVSMMLAQGVPVIVRVLVLPGHLECCHMPALGALADMNATNLWVSLRDQYCPDHLIREDTNSMNRRVFEGEYRAVRQRATKLGLRLVSEAQSKGAG